MEEYSYELDPVSSEENDRLAADLSEWINAGTQKLRARLENQQS